MARLAGHKGPRTFLSPSSSVGITGELCQCLAFYMASQDLKTQVLQAFSHRAISVKETITFCVWVIRLSHMEILLESYALLILILKCVSTMVLCLFVNFCIFLSTFMFSAYTLCCGPFLFRSTPS